MAAGKKAWKVGKSGAGRLEVWAGLLQGIVVLTGKSDAGLHGTDTGRKVWYRASWYWYESLVQGMVLGIGMAAVLAPPPVTHLLSGTVQDGTWTRTHRCAQDS